MRGTSRLIRSVVLPQIMVMVMAVLLLFNALHPEFSAVTFGKNGVVSLITPQKAYATPRIMRPARLSMVSLAHKPVDCNAHTCIALSFDDGPNPITTPRILSILEQTHTEATFFLVGSKVPGNGMILRRMAGDGFEIGNHSWSHGDMTTLSPEQVREELSRTQDVIGKTGVPRPTLFRPPYGAISDDVVKSAGLQTALWNEDPRDWAATDPATLAQTIIGQAQPGGVVDLHDIHQVTADALPAIIAGLRAKGYQFVTVSQLLHSRDRPGHAPFYGYRETP